MPRLRIVSSLFALAAAAPLTHANLTVLEPTPTQHAALMAGVAPETLAAAGVSAADTHDVMSAIAASSDLRAQIAAAMDLLDAANEDIAALRAELFEPLPSDEARTAKLTALAEAEADAEESRQDLADRLDVLFAVVLAQVSEGEGAMLTHARANAAAGLPAEMQVLSMTGEECEALACALRMEGRAARRGEELDAGMADLLENVRADEVVTGAESDLAANLDAVETVFESY